MPRNAIPTYRKQKTVGGDRAFVDLSGRRFYLGPYGSAESKLEYQRVLAEWNARACHPSVSPPDLTVTELVARFWEHCKSYYVLPDGRPSSQQGIFREILKPLKDLYGPKKASEFGPLALKALRQWMVDQGWVRTSINRKLGQLKHVFKWAVSEELIHPSVHQALLTVPGLKRGRSEARESEPVRPIPQAHIDAVRPHVSKQVWALIQLQLLTAARSGELIALRPVDLNTAGPVWTYSPSQHKTAHHDRERVIYFGPRAQEVLAPFLTNRPVTHHLFSAAEAEEEHRALKHAARKTPVSYGNRPGTNRQVSPAWKPGDCYTLAAYRRAITRACEKAGISAWHPHRLRHSAGTNLRAEFGLEVAQVMLGHARADVTQVYAEVNREKALDIASRVG
jgi:integrase